MRQNDLWGYSMKHLTAEQRAVLALLRRSLWGESPDIPEKVNWETLHRIAKEQAVISYMYDGARAAQAAVPARILEQWKQVLLRGVAKNERLLKAQDDLIAWFSQAGIPCVILKGSSVAQYYPQPDLRILGDIDILVKKADVERASAILEQQGYAYHEHEHGFHLSYNRPGAYVELHYHVTSLPENSGGKIAGEVIDGFLEDIRQGAVGSHHFPVLSEANQGLTLILHMIRHMFLGGIGLRQLADWAVYVANNDLSGVLPVLERCGVLLYAKVATKVCVQYLGLSGQDLSWCEDVEEDLCREFLGDIFRGGNMGTADTESLGSWFTDERIGSSGKSSLAVLLTRLTHLSYQRFPFTRKYKVLLPFFWVFLPVRYWVRSLLGLRPKKPVSKVVATARQRRELYDMLKMFEVKK